MSNLNKVAAAAKNIYNALYNGRFRNVVDPARRAILTELAQTSEYNIRLGEALLGRAQKAVARAEASKIPQDIASATKQLELARKRAKDLIRVAKSADKKLATYLNTDAVSAVNSSKIKQTAKSLSSDSLTDPSAKRYNPLAFITGAGVALTSYKLGRDSDDDRGLV